MLYTHDYRKFVNENRLLDTISTGQIDSPELVIDEGKMRETQFKKKQDEFQKACQERYILRGRIDEAEEELKGMVLLMEQFKNEGHQAEFEEIDSHDINENSVASLTIKVAAHPFSPPIWPEK